MRLRGRPAHSKCLDVGFLDADLGHKCLWVAMIICNCKALLLNEILGWLFQLANRLILHLDLVLFRPSLESLCLFKV